MLIPKRSTSLHDSPQPDPLYQTAAHMFDNATDFQIRKSNIANVAGASPTVNYFPVILGGIETTKDTHSAAATVRMVRRAAELQNVQDREDTLPSSCKFGTIRYIFKGAHTRLRTIYSFKWSYLVVVVPKDQSCSSRNQTLIQGMSRPVNALEMVDITERTHNQFCQFIHLFSLPRRFPPVCRRFIGHV